MSQTPIYTIGYGAREIAELLAALKANEIAFLIDVRSRPYSRYKPAFSKDALEEHLATAGIRYVFMGDTLGGQPPDADCYRDGKVIYEVLAQKPYYQEGIERLRQAYQQQLRVVLMCSEGKPEQCHRSKLIARTLTAEEIPVIHIDENDQLLSHEQMVLTRLNKGQPSLFGPDFQQFTSRKRYRPDDETH